MGELTKKVKDTLTGAKDTVTGKKEDDTDVKTQKNDPLTEYESKEPMSPAKIREHEPTAVKREMSEKITEPGKVGTNPEEAAERARRSGMTKGTAGAGKTTSEYEEGRADSNQ
jgi:predicted AAA+ superfamily ATPase